MAASDYSDLSNEELANEMWNKAADLHQIGAEAHGEGDHDLASRYAIARNKLNEAAEALTGLQYERPSAREQEAITKLEKAGFHVHRTLDGSQIVATEPVGCFGDWALIAQGKLHKIADKIIALHSTP